MLQVFADDSSTQDGDERLFIAGYVNSVRSWELFSEAWKDELKSSPSINYFKMAEANSLGGQFKRWSTQERDEKLRGLARVARHFEPVSFHISISGRLYRDLVKPVAPRGIGKPHFLASFAAITTVARFLAQNGVHRPVSFVFDRQEGVSADMEALFDGMVESLPASARELITGVPLFKDDTEVLPLQAADMLAWSVRREYETCTPPNTLALADMVRNSKMHVYAEIGRPNIENWAERFAEFPQLKTAQSKGEWQKLRCQINGMKSGVRNPFAVPSRNNLFGAVRRLFSRVRKL